VIAALLFSRAGDGTRETLREQGLRPEDVFPFATVYQGLAARGVTCAAHQDEAYARSSYSEQMFAGAAVRPYPDVAAGLRALADELVSAPGRRYHFFYVDSLDARAHSHGLDAPEFTAAVEGVLGQLEEFVGTVRGRLGDAVLLVTADHGLTPVDSATTV